MEQKYEYPGGWSIVHNGADGNWCIMYQGSVRGWCGSLYDAEQRMARIQADMAAREPKPIKRIIPDGYGQW